LIDFFKKKKMNRYASMPNQDGNGAYTASPSLVTVWFGDPSERELMPRDMYLAVYAAGGGKRNMANFVRQPSGNSGSSVFRTSDVHVFLSSDGAEINADNSRFFICRWASARGEWVPKEIPSWTGESQMKLVPEWFKARFWDNKQEKKHPWFMFALLSEADGVTQLFTSSSFPVHQYYPTGVKKTDPNDATCRNAFHKVLKTAPPTSLRPEHLLKKTTGFEGSAGPMRTYSGALPSPPASGSPAASHEFWPSDDTASEDGDGVDFEDSRKRKLAAAAASWSARRSHNYEELRMDGRQSQRTKIEIDDDEQVGAAQALLALRLQPTR
jgi:hypothetical protein